MKMMINFIFRLIDMFYPVRFTDSMFNGLVNNAIRRRAVILELAGYRATDYVIDDAVNNRIKNKIVIKKRRRKLC